MNKTKFISLIASIVFAMVFAFSCSSDDVSGSGSSSSESGEGNSQTYSYCLLSEEKMCLDGPFTSKDCNTAGGYPSNSCPYGDVEQSSSSVDSQGGGSSSISDTDQSSSSIGTALSSSSEEADQSGSSVKREICGTLEYDPSYNHCYYGTLYSNCSWLQQYQSDMRCDGEDQLLQCGVTDKYYNNTTEFCLSNLVYSKCNGLKYTPTSQKCENNIVLTRCESNIDNYYNPQTEFCSSNGNVNKLCNGLTYNPIVAKCNENGSAVRNLCLGIEYDPYSQYCANGIVNYKEIFTDIRDGKTYTYVTIGTQIWMAENLNYNAVGSTCHDNLASNCEKYGRLYDWTTAMAINTTYNNSIYTAQEKHKGICPEGWHLPSDTEILTLVKYVDPAYSSYFSSGNIAGHKLKATNGWWVLSGGYNGDGTDDYGFSALPGGDGSSIINFYNIGGSGEWWRTSESSAINANYINIYYKDNNVGSFQQGKTNLSSVRCIKD